MPDASLHTAHLQDWFRRLHAGNAAAADELLRVAGARLERLARRMLQTYPNVRRHADTGDVFQQAVFRLLRSLRQLDTAPASVRDFLGLAAAHIRRELLDLARRFGTAKRRGDVPLDAGGSEGGFDPAVSSVDADELERWRRFHEEVEKLPVEEREVISLRFYHGWAEADIAALYGVTERTVRRHWAAGCARLSGTLGGALPAPRSTPPTARLHLRKQRSCRCKTLPLLLSPRWPIWSRCGSAAAPRGSRRRRPSCAATVRNCWRDWSGESPRSSA